MVKVGKNWCSSNAGFKGFKGRLSSIIPGKVNVFLGQMSQGRSYSRKVLDKTAVKVSETNKGLDSLKVRFGLVRKEQLIY